MLKNFDILHSRY